MAKINGVFSGWKGKVGNASFSKSKGTQFIRSKSHPANPKTSNQISIRSKFYYINKMAAQLKTTLIADYWNPFFTRKLSGWAAFQKYNLLSMPGLDFNYSLAVMSVGVILPTLLTSATYNELTGNLIFEWNPVSTYNQLPDDRACFVIFDVDTFQFSLIQSSIRRSFGQSAESYPIGLGSHQLVAFCFFRRNTYPAILEISPSTAKKITQEV